MMDRLSQSQVLHSLWNIAGAASIRVKVLGIVVGMVALIGVFITVQLHQILHPILTSQLEQQGLAISDQIASQLNVMLPEDDPAAVHAYLLDRQQHFSDDAHDSQINYLLVFDANNNVIAHTFEGEIPSELLSPPRNAIERQEYIIGQVRESVIDITTPLESENATLRLGSAEVHVDDTVNTVTRRLIYTTILMIAIGFAAAAFLTWILTRPILSLVEATQAVAKGDFSYRIQRLASDEIGELALAFNSMTEALAQADQERRNQEQLRAGYITGIIRAQEDERKRVALELHDSTSQALTSLLVGLRNLENLTGEAALKRHTEDLRKQITDTLDDVHRLAWQLRPSTLDDLGLSAAIQRHVEDYQNRYQLHIDFLIHGIAEKRLPPEMETNIYRIVQEALTNIARHANAKTASILIDQRDQNIRIIVEDDGIGFDPLNVASQEKSLGLRGIQERARLFGGKMIIESVPEQGTSLFVELPITLERH